MAGDSLQGGGDLDFSSFMQALGGPSTQKAPADLQVTPDKGYAVAKGQPQRNGPTALPPGVKMPPPRPVTPAKSSKETIAVPKPPVLDQPGARDGQLPPPASPPASRGMQAPLSPPVSRSPRAPAKPVTPIPQVPADLGPHAAPVLQRQPAAPPSPAIKPQEPPAPQKAPAPQPPAQLPAYKEEAPASMGVEDYAGAAASHDLPFLMRADITPLFQELVRRRASDLHIGTSTPPTFRIDGEFCRAEFSLPSDSDVTETLLGYLSDAQRAVFLETGDLDFALELQGLARFRVNYCRKYGGISAAFRPIPAKIPHIDSLGMPQVLKSLAQLRRGLIIVTGPTGSGKSTTLAAIINEINQQRSAHIITIEDPVEFVHESKMCLVTHREIGINAVSFSDALRAAVREDPDIIMVGEMRDLDTIYQSIKAAEMGLLVFGTLHTNSASRAVDRIIDVFPPDQQDQIRTMLADSLKAVVAQQLLRKAQGEGRVAAVEILLSVPGFSNLIREGKIHQIPSLIQMGKDAGMLSMDQSLIDLVSRGLITKQEALSRAMDVRTFQRAGISSDTRYEEDDW